MLQTLDFNRRFYEQKVAPMIRSRFPEYEDRIAAGVAGEGSDCFGYDDGLSRDHDFGTGVCLWLTEEDYGRIGPMLSIAYNELVDAAEGGSALTVRLRDRRGVMKIRSFYSNVLGIDCDTAACVMTEEQWAELDHTCLATAVNGEIFRDDLGEFSRFRKYLLGYYPDTIWKTRLIEELHRFSSAAQVNYARCMTRRDLVAAEQCRLRGLEAAMELIFLLYRTYPPYYKWTYRALTELETEAPYAEWIGELAVTKSDPAAWEGRGYHPDHINTADRVIVLTERIAEGIAKELRKNGLTERTDPYLEIYCDEILSGLY